MNAISRPSKPAHTDQIEWPNGAGYTPCTPAYAEAVAEEQELMGELREAEEGRSKGLPYPKGYADLYERAHRAAARVVRLQATGHQGRGVRYAGAA
jgi:hypothetical protein